jgi:hypothetical protein
MQSFNGRVATLDIDAVLEVGLVDMLTVNGKKGCRASRMMSVFL